MSTKVRRRSLRAATIGAGHDRTGRFSWSSLRDTMGTPTQMIDTPSSAVSREGHPTDGPSSTPVGVQGPEDHSVDQAVTAALKSLVRSTLKAPSYVDAEKLSDSARSTAFKESLPAVRAHLLQTATGKQCAQGAALRHRRPRQARTSIRLQLRPVWVRRVQHRGSLGSCGSTSSSDTSAFGLLEANLARPSRILSLMLRR